ncbi:hypothetical protein, conserved [Eimeria acervulina]|uniref:Uncharacterized protein n=1 Tax=Eimeria acervulina TaxID=5801 RepID=U6GM16_EIMAC|nr:hypothetical protein, conserved [Eimeria acervulina]CDI80333.1 hypothetical protein, conserved [Eimeria acervulina]
MPPPVGDIAAGAVDDLEAVGGRGYTSSFSSTRGSSSGSSSSPPRVRAWYKSPAEECMFESSEGASYGPFPALLTLNSEGEIKAFEPVHPTPLCSLNNKHEDWMHVVCSQEEEQQEQQDEYEALSARRRRRSSSSSSSSNVVHRASPDLTYRLSLEETSVEGLLPSVLAASLRQLIGSKRMRGESPISSLLRFIRTAKTAKQTLTLTCTSSSSSSSSKKYSQTNPTLSYTNFWGSLLLAAFEVPTPQAAVIPKLAEE